MNHYEASKSLLAISTVLLSVAACVDATAPEKARPEQAKPDGGEELQQTFPFDVTPVDAVPNQWQAAEGWSFTTARSLGDINNDGFPDAVVEMGSSDGFGWQLVIVEGPLRRSLTLPGDEVASIPDVGLGVVGDATGDGLADVQVHMRGGDMMIVPSPFEGVMDTSAVGIPVTEQVIDVNGDGILDHVTYGPIPGGDDRVILDRIDVVFGPHTRWGPGTPGDLIIEPKCESASSPWDFSMDGIHALDDIDGDGLREMWFSGYSTGVGCPWGYLVSFPEEGVVDLTNWSGYATEFPAPPSVLPDQTGDGVAEVQTPEGLVLVGPVTVSDGVLSAAAELPVAPAVERALYSLDLDVDDDGLFDFLGFGYQVENETSIVPGTQFLVIVGSATGLESTTYSEGWDLLGGTIANDGKVIREDGQLTAMVIWSGGVAMVDVGSFEAP